ncbi:UvrD-helicase-domain-containing protein, partial [Patellaria atrata CBS 101060]
MDQLLAGLNGAQRSAVTSPASVLQVLAPPGSGKTKTLTARVAYLIANVGLNPSNIIVCTFTIKAAREMKDRVRTILSPGDETKLVLGTFHSVARRFLVTYGNYIGIKKDFGIADSSDSLSMIKRIIKRLKLTIEPSPARSRISSLKARSINCEEYAASKKSIEHQEFATIYAEYEELLRISNLLDYDDLLLRCVDLLRRYPECVSNVECVLIDEFQDTNHVQYELMRCFAQNRKRITIVGDPDQSIYGFRSAEIENLRLMRKHYSDTVVVMLEENYRSSGSILQSAMQVIEQDESRPAKNLLATHCVGERPVLRQLPTAAVEAQWVVKEIERIRLLTGGSLLTHEDFAILLRSASLSRHIESALGKAGIPYRMVGGHRFFDRVEVKIILDYLRVVNQPDHNDALIRVINVPSRKIGDVTVKSLLQEAEKSKSSLWEMVLGSVRGNRKPTTKISASTHKGLDTFTNVILTTQKKLMGSETQSFSLVEVITHIIKRLSFEEYLKKSYPEDFDSRWANVEELVAQATDMSAAIVNGTLTEDDSLPKIDQVQQQDLSDPEDILAKFLANVALSTEVQHADSAETPLSQVTISTIHAAKGLEWPVVFIPATYNGSIPHSRSEDTDEERRLLYVGMTRAKALLYLSWPIWNSKGETATLSSFLSHKRMCKCFESSGPLIKFTVAQDLARILRRPCPLEATMEEGRALVERAEDDLWPLHGGDHITGEYTTNFFDEGSPYIPSHQTSFKRRKYERVDTSNTTMVKTTMSSTETFSIASTVRPIDFVSAKAHFGQTALQTAASSTHMDVEKKHRISVDEKQEKLRKATKRSSSKRLIDQGSIKNFL